MNDRVGAGIAVVAYELFTMAGKAVGISKDFRDLRCCFKDIVEVIDVAVRGDQDVQEVRVALQAQAEIDMSLLAVRLGLVEDLVHVLDDDLLVFVQELENIVVVVIERIAVDLCLCAEIGDRDAGELLFLDQLFQCLK